MSADGGHLGWRSGSMDIILKVDHVRFKLAYWFQRNKFLNIKTMSATTAILDGGRGHRT
jgi:hypothetical protein